MGNLFCNHKACSAVAKPESPIYNGQGWETGRYTNIQVIV